MKGKNMEEILKELVEVMKVSNQRTLWDYLIAIAPIIISITALVISIKTTQKQNRIALFEKRYEIVYKLGFIFAVEGQVVEYEDENPSWFLENTVEDYYLTSNHVKNNNVQNFHSFYTGLILELAGIECLFYGVYTVDIMDFLNTFQHYVSKVHSKEVCKKDREELKEIFLKVNESKVMDKMEKYLIL